MAAVALGSSFSGLAGHAVLAPFNPYQDLHAGPVQDFYYPFLLDLTGFGHYSCMSSDISFQNSLQIHRRVLYAATSSLKRVTGRIFTISKFFHRGKPKLCVLISS